MEEVKKRVIEWMLSQNWYPLLRRNIAKGGDTLGRGLRSGATWEEFVDRYWNKSLIDKALCWRYTDEGHEFWDRLDTEYDEKYNEITRLYER